MKKVDIQRFRSEKVFLEIGNLRTIPIAGIIGIFDMDSTTLSAVSRAFLQEKQKYGGITSVSSALPKSFILYDDGELEQIYFSPFSASVLRHRLKEETN